MQRDRMLARVNSMKIIPPTHGGPNRSDRRAALQRWCRKFGVSYEAARAMIREEEAKMRAQGIDPWEVVNMEVTSKGKGQMELSKITTSLDKVREFFKEETV